MEGMEEFWEEDPGLEIKLEESDMLCMLCSEIYNPASKENKKLASLSTTIKYKKFCKELECFLAERGITEVRKKKRVKRRLKGELNLAYGQLSICGSCLKLICGAMEVKCLAEKVEDTVRDLQMQVLEGLEKLDGHMDGFLGKMKMIEGVVKKADEDKLREYLEGNVEETLRGDVHQFRERILDAVTDLKIYRKEITDKTVSQELYERKEQHRLFQRRKNMTDQKVQTDLRGEVISSKKGEIKKKIKCKTKEQQTDPIFVIENEETPPPPLQIVKVTSVKVEVDPTDYSMEEETAIPFEDDLGHDDTYPEEYPVEEKKKKKASPPRKRPRRSVTLKKKPARAPSPSSGDDSDQEGEKKVPSYLEDSSSASSPEDSSDFNFSDEDEDVQRIKNPRRRGKNPALIPPPGVSPFKHKILLYVAEKLEEKKSTNWEEEAILFDDPRMRYYFDYNSATDTLSLENIPVILHDSEKFLECSLCQFQARGQYHLRKMHVHILGRHLDAFQCSFCPAKLSSWRTYNEHVSGHKDTVECDICGKPLQSRETLRSHRWTHMSQDEKADAVQRGMKNPLEASKKMKGQPKNCFCATCGKAFRTEKMVQMHEKIHEERDRVPCHLCGKLLLREGTSMDCHLKYACQGTQEEGEEKKRECAVCHRPFKNQMTLRRHMALVHPKDPTKNQHPCEVCGHVFKTGANLRIHREIHGEERNYKCGKCGGGFKQERNMKRHEKTCGGGGGRGGKRVGGRREVAEEESREEVEVKVGNEGGIGLPGPSGGGDPLGYGQFGGYFFGQGSGGR